MGPSIPTSLSVSLIEQIIKEIDFANLENNLKKLQITIAKNAYFNYNIQ